MTITVEKKGCKEDGETHTISVNGTADSYCHGYQDMLEKLENLQQLYPGAHVERLDQ